MLQNCFTCFTGLFKLTGAKPTKEEKTQQGTKCVHNSWVYSHSVFFVAFVGSLAKVWPLLGMIVLIAGAVWAWNQPSMRSQFPMVTRPGGRNGDLYMRLWALSEIRNCLFSTQQYNKLTIHISTKYVRYYIYLCKIYNNREIKQNVRALVFVIKVLIGCKTTKYARQKVPLKFHKRYLAHTLKDKIFILRWILRALGFKSS